MIIKEISLKNFKSHRNTKIQFEKGINLIAGGNGAGKSSILEAILVALYGVRQGYARKSDLVMTGASEYSIEIVFELDNRDYRIVRKSGGNSELTGDVRIEGDQKINEWVEKHISPFHVFTGAVYVRQGEIEEIISDESEREKIIRRITRIGDYENAWKNLGAVIKELENEMKRFMEIARQKEECEKRIQEKSSEIDETRREIEKCENRLRELRESIEKVLEEKKVFDKMKEEIDRLSPEILKLEGEIRGLTERIGVLREQKAELEQKIASLFEEIKKLESLEEDAKKYSELQELYRDFLKSIQEVETKLRSLESEKERLSAELRKCEEEKKSLESVRREISEIEEKIKFLTPEAEKWRNLRGKVERKAQIEKILSEKNMTAERVEKIYLTIQKAREADKVIKEEFGRVSQQKGFLISEEKRLLESIERLNSAIGYCPVCGRELTEDHKRELILNYSLELEKIRKRLTEIENEEKKLDEERKKVEEVLSKQDLVMKYKQLADELNKISQDLREVEVEELKSKSEEYERMKNRLDFLKEVEAKALKSLENFDSLVEKLEKVRFIYSEAQKSKEQLLNRLKERGFSSIEGLEAEIRKLKASYEEWIGLKKAKDELDSAKTKLRTLDEEIERTSGIVKAKRSELEERVRTFDKIKGRYDEGRHLELERLERDLSKEIAALEEKAKVLRKNLEGLLADREYLEKQLETIKDADKKVKAIEKAIPELNKIREKFASYKNIVAEAALKEVERYASEIFEEFTEGKYSGIKLKRVVEYGKEKLKIFVIRQGEEKETSFVSGGELVALGIAFRLALSMFEAKGRIPLLILDEPTPYLDEERRRKLVEITLNYLRRIPQVIIVSHDEELKDAADRVISVEYRGGVSVVASQ